MDTRFKGQRIRQSVPTKIKTLTVNHDNQDNAKVKVQYIQNHHIVEKIPMSAASPLKYSNVENSEVEAVNVEYLDESTSEELPIKIAQEPGNRNVNISKHTKEPFKDTFYPNAVHCLIALYKNKYLEMKGKTEQQIRALRVWDQITKEMNESYFNFSRTQIKEKFSQLRKQYFGVSTSEEIEAFDYFDQMHDIYQDKHIDAIAAGEPSNREKFQTTSTYQDDELQLEEEEIEEVNDEQELPQQFTEPQEHNYQTTAQEVSVEMNNEIAHKEHEFIDMVEKELQAIVEGRSVTQPQVHASNPEESDEIVSHEMILHQQEEIVEHEDISVFPVEQQAIQTPVQTLVIKREKEEDPALQTPNPKRFKLETVSAPQVVTVHVSTSNESPSEQQLDSRQTTILNENVVKTELSLAEYNAHQERRHQEKMELMRQNLLLQERAIEMQRHLMEELIKRL